MDIVRRERWSPLGSERPNRIEKREKVKIENTVCCVSIFSEAFNVKRVFVTSRDSIPTIYIHTQCMYLPRELCVSPLDSTPNFHSRSFWIPRLLSFVFKWGWTGSAPATRLARERPEATTSAWHDRTPPSQLLNIVLFSFLSPFLPFFFWQSDRTHHWVARGWRPALYRSTRKRERETPLLSIWL